MKTTRKILALVMVMAMVLAMAVTASAAGTPTGTITIQNQQSGSTYNVYRMFDWVETATPGIYWYKINEAWQGFNTTEETYFDLDEDGFLIAMKESESEVAKNANTYAATVDKTYENVGASITNAPYGYYLLVSTLDENKNVAMGTLNSEAGLILREKNTVGGLPTINKTIENETQEFKVGDTIDYKIEIACKEGDKAYTIHDTMKGSTFNDDMVVAIAGMETSEYKVTLTEDGLNDDCTFHVTIALNDAEASFKAYQKITITYSATVTEDAVTHGLSNTAKIEDAGDSTVEDEKATYTVKKVIKGQTDKVLQGAEFQLYEVNGDTYTEVGVVAIDSNSDHVVDYYRPAGTNETGVAIVAGEATIKMLENDKTYALKETKAPVGYKAVNGYISATEKAFVVENEALDALPETGGVGTTMFYIVGAVLVLGAATLLATKKRMAAN